MKNILKSILFIAILLVLLAISSIFAVQDNHIDGRSQIGIAGEKENTIDFIVLGDSESYASIVPMNIYKEYGYTGYVRGTVAQKLFKTYNMLEEACRNQNPKVVVLETNAIFRNYKLPLAITAELEGVFPIIEYHDRWKTMIDKEAIKNRVDKNKGYKYSKKIAAVKDKGYMVENDGKVEIRKKNVMYLEKIVNYCNKNDIKLVFVSTPSLKNWNYKKHNSVDAFAKEHNIDYYDMNLDKEIGIDWSKDTRDRGDHMNYTGARKVTKALGKYLDGLNLLEDHRNDENYTEWNELIKK